MAVAKQTPAAKKAAAAKRKAANAGRDPLPSGVGTERGLQLPDLDLRGRRAAQNIMEQGGQNVQSKARGAIKRKKDAAASRKEEAEGALEAHGPFLEGDPMLKQKADAPKKIGAAHKAMLNAGAMQNVLPHLRNTDTSVEGGADRRTDLIRGAYDRQRAQEASGVMDDNTGANFYFDHANPLVSLADEHGMSSRDVAKASTLMSPQNSPSNEQAAVASLVNAHSNTTGVDTVVTTPEVIAAASLGKANKTNDIPADQEIPVTNLTPRQFANLSTSSGRSAVQDQTQTNLYDLSRGGTKSNIANATSVVRGDDFNFNHLSNPKLSAYGGAVEDARRGIVTGEENSLVGGEGEYRNRTAHVREVMTGNLDSGQDYLDLWGLKHSKEGILNPEGNTAEDTWMNAIHSGQSLAKEGTGKGHSPAKVWGSADPFYKTNKVDRTSGISVHPDAGVSGPTSAHAVNNASSIESGQNVGQMAGLVDRDGNSMMPATAAQAVAWGEARRRASADPEYAQAGMPTGDFNSSNSLSPQFQGSFSVDDNKASRSRPKDAESYRPIQGPTKTGKPIKNPTPKQLSLF